MAIKLAVDIIWEGEPDSMEDILTIYREDNALILECNEMKIVVDAREFMCALVKALLDGEL